MKIHIIVVLALIFTALPLSAQDDFLTVIEPDLLGGEFVASVGVNSIAVVYREISNEGISVAFMVKKGNSYKKGPNFNIAKDSKLYAYSPSIVFNEESQRYLLVWIQSDERNSYGGINLGSFGSYTQIRGQMFSDSGKKVGGEFLIRQNEEKKEGSWYASGFVKTPKVFAGSGQDGKGFGLLFAEERIDIKTNGGTSINFKRYISLLNLDMNGKTIGNQKDLADWQNMTSGWDISNKTPVFSAYKDADGSIYLYGEMRRINSYKQYLAKVTPGLQFLPIKENPTLKSPAIATMKKHVVLSGSHGSKKNTQLLQLFKKKAIKSASKTYTDKKTIASAFVSNNGIDGYNFINCDSKKKAALSAIFYKKTGKAKGNYDILDTIPLTVSSMQVLYEENSDCYILLVEGYLDGVGGIHMNVIKEIK